MFLVCFLSPGLVVFWNCPKELQCIVNKVIWKKTKKLKETNSPSSLEEEKYIYFGAGHRDNDHVPSEDALYPCFLLAQLEGKVVTVALYYSQVLLGLQSVCSKQHEFKTALFLLSETAG